MQGVSQLLKQSSSPSDLLCRLYSPSLYRLLPKIVNILIYLTKYSAFEDGAEDLLCEHISQN